MRQHCLHYRRNKSVPTFFSLFFLSSSGALLENVHRLDVQFVTGSATPHFTKQSAGTELLRIMALEIDCSPNYHSSVLSTCQVNPICWLLVHLPSGSTRHLSRFPVIMWISSLKGTRSKDPAKF